MDDERLAWLLDIAEHAVRSLLKHTGIHSEVTEEDLEDMRQEALSRMLAALARRPQLDDERGYLFVIARWAAMDYVIWWNRGIRSRMYFPPRERAEKRKLPKLVSLEALEDAGFQARAEERQEYVREPLPPEQAAALLRIFYDSRSKRGRRGLMAAVRDVRIVNCVVMGYTNTGIAHELGLPSRREASHYRLSIRARLRNYAERKGVL
jgi:DNA-directed RNA polymerase specialized sigma24 family protein